MIPYQFIKRIRIIFAFVLIFLVALAGKITYNSIIINSMLTNKAENLWNRSFPIMGERGFILDSNCNPLTMNEPTVSIYAIPHQIVDKEETSRKLSSVLSLDEKYILSRITKRSSNVSFHPYGKKINNDLAKRISEMNLKGIYLVNDNLRVYPYKEYIAPLLGFVGIDNDGFAGLEYYYNDYLKGKNGSLEYMMDAKGGLLKNQNYSIIPPSRGLDLKLSLDINLQNILEREMQNALMKYNPKEIVGIIMNPNNGEILSIGNRPTYDNNKYKEYPQEIYNHILPVYNTFEPGSTFKAMTFAAALNEKKINMFKDTYYDKGYEIVSGRRIKSWKKGGHGLQTYLQVLENSSNPGFVSISRKLGPTKMYEYVQKFGFLEKSGVDIQGENQGIFFHKDNFHELECATTSFGQSISINAVQLVSAFSSTINGGYLYTPHVGKALLNSFGETVYEFKYEPKRQVISEETSSLMRYALESVVANGSGKKAFIDGYRVGGKTGTAQIVEDGKYLDGRYLLSFIAGAPMNDPKIVVYFSMKEPKNCIQYGGTTIGPIIKTILEDSLIYLNVKKDFNNQINKKMTWMDENMINVPNYIGLPRKKVSSFHFKFEFIGEGDTVIDQLPRVGEIIPQGSTIMLQMG